LTFDENLEDKITSDVKGNSDYVSNRLSHSLEVVETKIEPEGEIYNSLLVHNLVLVEVPIGGIQE
jgi:hypothetical protein